MFKEENDIMVKEVELTNEEKKVEEYENNKPTYPEDVDESTPLESLNLNWTEKELPERIRTKHVHRLHPYLGKYIPQLVEIFLRKYFTPGQTVLDPFCGSGTTLVQANELKINSIGADISEFNILISKVKTSKYNLEFVKHELTELLDRTEKLTGNYKGDPSLFADKGEHIAKAVNTNNPYLNTWFHKNALNELLTFRELTNDYENQDLFRIILSRAARSARLTTHFDLDFPKRPQTEPYYCYKHRRTCKPTDSAFKFIKRYGLDTLKRIEDYSKLRSNASVKLIHGDSRLIDLPKIDGIITSPPYVGLIDYHEQHKYAFELLGLIDKREDEIGRAENGNSIKAKVDYTDAISQVFLNSIKDLKKNGVVIIVAGDRSNLYPNIGDLSGLILEDKVVRHVNRRTGRRNTNFFETVFIYRKPS